jgi:hypothetical protein
MIYSCDVYLKTLLGILGYWALLIWGLFEVGMPSRPPWGRVCQTPYNYAGWSGYLYTSFNQDLDSVFFYFFSIKPVMLFALMLKDYSTRAFLMPSCFSSSYRPVEKHVSYQVVTWPTFLFSALYFLDRRTGHPVCHDARRLLYECILDALWIFSSSFRSIGSLLIGRHSTSLRSARLQTGRLLSWFFFFSFLDQRERYSTCRWLQTSSWPSRGRCTYTSLGGLWDMGTPRSPPTMLMAVPNKSVRPTRRSTDLTEPNRPDLWPTEDQSVQGSVGGRSGCDEWLTKWCGLTLDWVLQARLRLDLRWCRWRAGVKGLCLAGPPRSGETSRLGWRDPAASGVKCGPRGGKKSKTKSSTVAGAR